MEGVRPRAAAELVASGQWVASLAKCAEGSGLDCWVEPKRTFLTRPTFKSHGRCLSLPFELDTKSTAALQRPLLQAVAEGDPWMAKQKDHCSICLCSFANQNHCKSISPLYMQKKKVRPEFQHLLPLPFSFPFAFLAFFLSPLPHFSLGTACKFSLSTPRVARSLTSPLWFPSPGFAVRIFFGQWKHNKLKRITLLHLPKSLGYQITISNLKKRTNGFLNSWLLEQLSSPLKWGKNLVEGSKIHKNKKEPSVIRPTVRIHQWRWYNQSTIYPDSSYSSSDERMG